MMENFRFEIIKPREPSVEYLREVIRECDEKEEWYFSLDITEREDVKEEHEMWLRSKLIKLVICNRLLDEKENQ